MNLLEEKGYLSKMICGSNFSYILNEDIFSPTEYKVLQSQNNSCFVKCMKMLYNGKVQLYYLTKDYKSLLSMLSNLGGDSFLVVVANLLTDVVEVKSNGFLSCQNIDLSFEHVYVDSTTYKVHLVYLPLGVKVYSSESTFENEMRAGLIKLIAENSILSATVTNRLTVDLSDGTLSLENLCERVKEMCGRIGNTGTGTSVTGSDRVVFLRLKSMNAPTEIVLEMNKSKYVIGKNATSVDGVISFNKAISRIHCCIEKKGNDYFVADLGSANGTFINGTRVQPKQQYKVSDDDILRLADSDFQVIM